jgi:DNA polymerase III subunit alpha
MDLIIDTETTGLTHLAYASRSNYHLWPRLVQLAWILAEKQVIHCQENVIIRPNGFQIPFKATQVHGITQQRALTEGKTIIPQLKTLNQAMKEATALIAHNLKFDLGVLQSEALRLDLPLDWPRHHHCTAHMGKLFIQKTRGRTLKSFPRLDDLHQAIFSHSYHSRHDAHADAHACHKIYKYLKKTIQDSTLAK